MLTKAEILFLKKLHAFAEEKSKSETKMKVGEGMTFLVTNFGITEKEAYDIWLLFRYNFQVNGDYENLTNVKRKDGPYVHATPDTAVFAMYALKDFKCGNVTGKKINDNLYVVYSYGTHYPMYVYHNGQWYYNNEKFRADWLSRGYSPSTERQKNKYWSYDVKYINSTTAELQKLIGSEGGSY